MTRLYKSDANSAFFASRAMGALEVLAFGPATATQISRELQVHQRTARRLLNRMTADGWLVREDKPAPTYSPTLRIVALAAQLAARTALTQADDLLTELRQATAADVHLAIPSYRSALRLARASDHGAAVAALRDLAPVHAVAAGKVLLAFRDVWREAVLEAPELAAVTAHTLRDRMRFASTSIAHGSVATRSKTASTAARSLPSPCPCARLRTTWSRRSRSLRADSRCLTCSLVVTPPPQPPRAYPNASDPTAVKRSSAVARAVRSTAARTDLGERVGKETFSGVAATHRTCRADRYGWRVLGRLAAPVRPPSSRSSRCAGRSGPWVRPATPRSPTSAS